MISLKELQRRETIALILGALNGFVTGAGLAAAVLVPHIPG